MKGIYDYRGECFGYIINGKLYDLEGKHSGYVTDKMVTTLDHQFVWHVQRDGLYDEHWVSIGYMGSEDSENE